MGSGHRYHAPRCCRDVNEVLAGATPRPRERARLRAVGPWLWGSIVPIHTRPRMVRDRSPGRLGADGEVTVPNPLLGTGWKG